MGGAEGRGVAHRRTRHGGRSGADGPSRRKQGQVFSEGPGERRNAPRPPPATRSAAPAGRFPTARREAAGPLPVAVMDPQSPGRAGGGLFGGLPRASSGARRREPAPRLQCQSGSGPPLGVAQGSGQASEAACVVWVPCVGRGLPGGGHEVRAWPRAPRVRARRADPQNKVPGSRRAGHPSKGTTGPHDGFHRGKTSPFARAVEGERRDAPGVGPGRRKTDRGHLLREPLAGTRNLARSAVMCDEWRPLTQRLSGARAPGGPAPAFGPSASSPARSPSARSSGTPRSGRAFPRQTGAGTRREPAEPRAEGRPGGPLRAPPPRRSASRFKRPWLRPAPRGNRRRHHT